MYRLYCEFCNYNRVTDGNDLNDLIPYKRSKIQTQIPKLDENKKTTIPGKFASLPKQYKCPKCGRLIKLFNLNRNEKNNDSRN